MGAAAEVTDYKWRGMMANGIMLPEYRSPKTIEVSRFANTQSHLSISKNRDHVKDNSYSRYQACIRKQKRAKCDALKVNQGQMIHNGSKIKSFFKNEQQPGPR